MINLPGLHHHHIESSAERHLLPQNLSIKNGHSQIVQGSHLFWKVGMYKSSLKIYRKLIISDQIFKFLEVSR